MRVFVDTSALVALLDEDDLRHRTASEAFQDLARTADLITHNYIHVESMAVARRRLGPGAVLKLSDDLLPAMDTIWVDEPLHRAAMAAHRTGTGGPSLVDHVSFALMRRLGVQFAFAFDADFEAEGFRWPPVIGPTRPRRLSETPAPYGSDDATGTDMVSVSEIAARTGRPVNTIQSWRRRHPDFPAPLAQLGAGPIWSWAPVRDWVAVRDRGRGRHPG